MKFLSWSWLFALIFAVVGSVVAINQGPTIIADKGKTRAQWQAERVVRTKLILAAAAHAVERYRAETGTLPQVLSDVDLKVRTDPWGTELIYERMADDGYRLLSAGPDQTWNTADDIVRGIDAASDAEFDAILRHLAPELK